MNDEAYHNLRTKMMDYEHAYFRDMLKNEGRMDGWMHRCMNDETGCLCSSTTAVLEAQVEPSWLEIASCNLSTKSSWEAQLEFLSWRLVRDYNDN